MISKKMVGILLGIIYINRIGGLYFNNIKFSWMFFNG